MHFADFLTLLEHSAFTSDVSNQLEQEGDFIVHKVLEPAVKTTAALAATAATATAGSALAAVHAGKKIYDEIKPFADLYSAYSHVKDLQALNQYYTDHKHQDSPRPKSSDFDNKFPISTEGPLVGIEPNPGPKAVVKASKKKTKQLQPSRRRLNGPTITGPPTTSRSLNVVDTLRPSQFHRYSTATYMGRIGLKLTGSHRIADLGFSATTGHALANYNQAPGAVYRVNPRAYDCNPANFGSPLTQISESYLQFRIVKFGVMYSPSCATTTAGSCVIALDPDAATIVSLAQSVASYSSLESSIVHAPWEKTYIDFSRFVDKQMKFLNEYGTTAASIDEAIMQRMCSAGKIGLMGSNMSISGVTPVDGSIFGSYYFFYEIDFFGLGRRLALNAPNLNDGVFINEEPNCRDRGEARPPSADGRSGQPSSTSGYFFRR